MSAVPIRCPRCDWKFAPESYGECPSCGIFLDGNAKPASACISCGRLVFSRREIREEVCSECEREADENLGDQV